MRTIGKTVHTTNRYGVTLTEVLMSLMIMSIGISVVATLFPIAALRSAQATKLTNGAVTKYNVQALITARPALVFDPDGDFINSSPTTPAAVAARWQRLTEHFRFNTEKNYIVDPNGYLARAASFPFGGPVTANNGVLNVVPRGNPREFTDYFGNTSANQAAPVPYQVLPRYDGGLRAAAFPTQLNAATLRDFELLASELSTLGDGWDTVFDETCEGVIDDNGNFVPSGTPASNVVGVRLPDSIDLSSIPTSTNYAGMLSIADPELTRITVFSVDGRISQSYPLTAALGQDCIWTEAAVGPFPATDFNRDGIIQDRPLPIEFSNVPPGNPADPTRIQVGRVLIQTKRAQDFNWLLTVRRGADGRARGVDIVVMFNNGRSAEDERVYPAVFRKDGFGVSVARTSGVSANGDPAEPFLKRGGWVLDVENARWYRISEYKDHPVVAGPPAFGPTTHYLLTLENAALESSPPGGGGAIFIPGIVDVYPLGSIQLPASMTPQNF